VVVARHVSERPGVAVVSAGVGVRGAAQVQTGQALAQDAGGRAGRRVRRRVVGDAVGGDRDAGVGLGDGVIDGAAGVVVVAGHVSERPGVAVVSAGVRMRRAAQVQTGQALAQNAGGRAAGRVSRRVVGDAVGGDRDAGVGFGDGVIDGAAGIVVVA